MKLIVHIAVAILGSLLCLDRAPAAESRPDKGPMLQVPRTDSKPVVDGTLEEPCWKDAAQTGPLKVTRGEPAKSTTEAFILRDADHLYVGVHCAGRDAVTGQVPPGKPSKGAEYVDLLIDSNGDRNSYYLIRITPKDGGEVTSSYNEHTPPWHDRTWLAKLPWHWAANLRPGCSTAIAEMCVQVGSASRVPFERIC